MTKQLESGLLAGQKGIRQQLDWLRALRHDPNFPVASRGRLADIIDNISESADGLGDMVRDWRRDDQD